MVRVSLLCVRCGACAVLSFAFPWTRSAGPRHSSKQTDKRPEVHFHDCRTGLTLYEYVSLQHWQIIGRCCKVVFAKGRALLLLTRFVNRDQLDVHAVHIQSVDCGGIASIGRSILNSRSSDAITPRLRLVCCRCMALLVDRRDRRAGAVPRGRRWLRLAALHHSAR